MTLEQRKDNTYYDKTGKQILVGDLLKVYHFTSRNRNYYIYHIVVMNHDKEFPTLACRSYYENSPHYNLFSLCDNSQRIYFDAEIISMQYRVIQRKKIKVV